MHSNPGDCGTRYPEWDECPHCGAVSPEVMATGRQQSLSAPTFCDRCERRRVAVGHLLERSVSRWWLRPLAVVAVGILVDDWYRNVRLPRQRRNRAQPSGEPQTTAARPATSAATR